MGVTFNFIIHLSNLYCPKESFVFDVAKEFSVGSHMSLLNLLPLDFLFCYLQFILNPKRVDQHFGHDISFMKLGKNNNNGYIMEHFVPTKYSSLKVIFIFYILV